MTRPAMTTPLLESLFHPGTLGAFLSQSAQGWPEAFGAQVGSARVRVSRSEVKIERQHRSERCGGGILTYVRISLEMTIARQGCEDEVRRVEEMFSGDHLDLLDLPLDDGAPGRVARGLAEAIRALDPETPIDRLLADCLAPMKLFEPLLDALLPELPPGCLGRDLNTTLHRLLEARDGELWRSAIDADHEARLVVVRPRAYDGFRYHGQVRGRACIELRCRHTDKRLGLWKTDTPVLKPDTHAHLLPHHGQLSDTIEASLASWGDELRRTLGEAVCGCEGGEAPKTIEADRLLEKCSFWDHLLRRLR